MDTATVYRCPQCGGDISFDAHSHKLKCPYCDSEFDIETLETYQQEILKDMTNDINWEDETHHIFDDESLIIYSCEQCGGQIMTSKETIATHCPYCHSPIVFHKNVSGELKPDYLIPFSITKEEAKQKLKNFYKNKPFIPKSFKDDQYLDEIKGMYVPFWVYHCQAHIYQQYRTTKVRTFSDSHYIYTETNHYLVSREGHVDFENVPVDGASQIDNIEMQSIEPYRFQQAIPFHQNYLVGYFADKFDEDVKTCENEANQRIKNSSDALIKETIQFYTTIHKEKENIQLKNKNYDYYLLPVWFLNVTWNHKQYRFVMNGQTGKFIGNLPADMKLFWKDVFLFMIVLFVFIYAFLFFVG